MPKNPERPRKCLRFARRDPKCIAALANAFLCEECDNRSNMWVFIFTENNNKKHPAFWI